MNMEEGLREGLSGNVADRKGQLPLSKIPCLETGRQPVVANPTAITIFVQQVLVEWRDNRERWPSNLVGAG